MKSDKDLLFNTRAIHGGQSPDKAYGAVMPPIYQTSTYAQSAPGVHKGYEYSRTHNPTRTALQNAIASVEGAKYGLAFASGLAATDAVIKLLNAGDEVVSVNDLYGGTYRIFTKIFQPLGIRFKFVDMSRIENLESAISPATKLIWVETPTNPMINVVDLKAVALVSKKHSCRLVVDSTFASPYLQQPLALGADIVLHSATKYLSGHSDTIMGLVATSNDDLAQRLAFIQNASGAVPGPQDCFLTLRGIKTLHVRMQRHCENALEVARFLSTHPKVSKVNYPGLETHPQHSIAKTQMKAFGGMLSFTLKDSDLTKTVETIKRLQLFTLAESLGGVESLVGHPATMTHASIPKEEREKTGVTDMLIRLSVGIEDVNDLIDDLKQAIG